jgi:hypothetical protein
MTRCLKRGAALGAAGVLLSASPAKAQTETPVPWSVGEYLEYTVKFGVITAGSGRMRVLGIDSVRGRAAWRLRFDISGGALWVKVRDSYDSWVDVERLHSLRFEVRLDEPAGRRTRIYDIFPDRLAYRLNQEEERATVPDPLDDASFFYFVRTIPLEVGKSYNFDRYFDPRSNPVTIHVLRKDTVQVPAGRFPAIVLQPMIKTTGIFSEGGHAEVWLSDDRRRILLQMKTKLKFGSLNLYLRRVESRPARSDGAPGPRP